MGDNLNGLRNYLQKYASLAENRKQSIDIAGNEFQDIRNLSVEYKKKFPSHEGAKEINRKKNRYKDILPYDYSRVKLPVSPLNDGSDYINANFIKDFNDKVCYIASQGPMPATVNDFWKMTWSFDVKLVIMACREIELGKPRCQRYWPLELGGTDQYKDIDVKLVRETSVAHNMMVRELLVKKKSEKREITQLHYMDWPDHGAPETSETILQLAKIARQKQSTDTPPILIHCSAGCGRTGAIIAIDYARKMIEQRVGDLDVIKIVNHLRQQRPAMVQTKEQYEFIYEVVRELVTKELNRCDDDFHTSATSENLYENIALVLREKEINNSKIEGNLQKPSPVVERSQHDNTKVFTKNDNAVTNVPKQIILPSEHAVNMGAGFRRSRSQRKAASPKLEMKNQRPPLPRKISEQPFKFGPELPGKAPGSAARRDEDCNFVVDKHGKKHPPLPSKPATQRDALGYENVIPPSPLAIPVKGDGKLPKTAYENIGVSALSPMADEEYIPIAKPVDANSYPMKSQTSNIKHADPRHSPTRKTVSCEKNGCNNNTNKGCDHKRPLISPATQLTNSQNKLQLDNFKHLNNVLDNNETSSTKGSNHDVTNKANNALYAPVDNSSRNTTLYAPVDNSSRNNAIYASADNSSPNNTLYAPADNSSRNNAIYASADNSSPNNTLYAPADNSSRNNTLYAPADNSSRHNVLYPPVDNSSGNNALYAPVDNSSPNNVLYAPVDNTSRHNALYAPVDNTSRHNVKAASLGKVIGKPPAPTYTTVEKNNMDVKKGIMGDANKTNNHPLNPQWTLSIQSSSSSSAPPLPKRTPESHIIIKEEDVSPAPNHANHANSFGLTSAMQDYTKIDALDRGGGALNNVQRPNSAYKHLVNLGTQQRSTSVGNAKSMNQQFGGIVKMFQKSKPQEVKSTNEKSQSMPDYRGLGYNIRLDTKPRGPRELPVKFK